ncbi:MAG: hypothetical protein ABSA70_17095 [Terriglobia bacterium]
MRRLAIAGLLCLTFLVPGVESSFGGKKPKKPIQERLVARIVPSESGKDGLFQAMSRNFDQMFDSVEVVIQEYSSDQEAQDLAQIFRSGGDDALEKAFNKTDKGYFRIGQGVTTPLVFIISGTEGPVRKLIIAGKVPSRFGNLSGSSFSLPHIPHTYTCVGLDINEDGKGKGVLVLLANVAFDLQGRMTVKALPNETFQLTDVHVEK